MNAASEALPMPCISTDLFFFAHEIKLNIARFDAEINCLKIGCNLNQVKCKTV